MKFEQGIILTITGKLARIRSCAYLNDMALPAPRFSTAPGGLETAEPQQARLIALYKDRLDYLFNSFAAGRAMEGARLTFNDSLKAGARSLNPRAKRKPTRRPIDFELETRINVRATELARARGSNSGHPDQADINTASSEIIAQSTPRRGRPSDSLLKYHVHALMALHNQTSGAKLRAGVSRNGEYAPHIKSLLERTIVERFRTIDPQVTVATLVDIIVKAERLKAIEGKRFNHFFPFYGGSIDEATGYPVPGPGYRLERFVRVAPIYSS